MTRDDTIRMAREANVSIRGYYDETGPDGAPHYQVRSKR